ncbi:hypothetical protein [Burkholderia sp. Ac-20353]|uniref:hypothetical protein n=1 Tax=Burkholderia sp. Ac-20353 TaxID=2703894 RepID=UPI00197BAFE7|nr:hypothetical protein [Burkholderia sp. Ac-20353]MBN3787729.1 hypothetical protein [Burkholderia sp. Ac-20353]
MRDTHFALASKTGFLIALTIVHYGSDIRQPAKRGGLRKIGRRRIETTAGWGGGDSSKRM